MKKIYQNPTTQIVKIHTVKMIAASQVGVGATYNGTTVLGRDNGGDFWDDEEE